MTNKIQYHYLQFNPKGGQLRAFDGQNAVWVNVQYNDAGELEQAPDDPIPAPVQPQIENVQYLANDRRIR